MKKSEWQAILRNANPALVPETGAAVPSRHVPAVMRRRDAHALDETMLLHVSMKTIAEGPKIEPDSLERLADFGHRGAELTVQEDRDVLGDQVSYRFILVNHGSPPNRVALRGRWTSISVAETLVAELFVPRNPGSELARLVDVPFPDRHIVIAAFLADAMVFAGWPRSSYVSNVKESASIISGQIISGDADAKENFSIQLASAMRVTCNPHPKTVLTVSRRAMEDLLGH